MSKKNLMIHNEDLSEIYNMGFFMERTLNTVTKTLNSMLKKRRINLQCSQFIVLKYLYKIEGVSQSKLAKLLDKDPAAINRTTNYLEQKGYLTKKLIDRKTIGIYLTSKAMEIKDEICLISDELNELTFKGITEKQKKNGLTFIDRVYSNCVDYNTKEK
ncbi:MAG: MarR family transcriptional regulator [Muribaculaceae bacterium]|nr:MarR family transcriptional regulator [Muribaculaceae bacterium]